MNITDKDIADYTEAFTTPEPELVQNLIHESERELEYIDTLSGRQTGMLLKLLVQISGARRILEVGTFTGYSALMMADGMPADGLLITLEMNKRYEAISGKYFAEESYSSKIKQLMGNALEIIPTLDGPFDLVYIDADKQNYPEYWKLAREKTRSGSLIVLDNVLWDGEVLSPKGRKERAIHQTSELIRDDDGVEQLMLPLRDGVSIVRVRDM
jgi:caffeoyl-CoA O-methyltransferase